MKNAVMYFLGVYGCYRLFVFDRVLLERKLFSLVIVLAGVVIVSRLDFHVQLLFYFRIRNENYILPTSPATPLHISISLKGRRVVSHVLAALYSTDRNLLDLPFL
jgi:hypothetical protein